MRGAEATAGAPARRRRAGRSVAHDGVVRPRWTRHADLRGDPAARPADRPRAGLPAQPDGAQPAHAGEPHHRPGRRHDRHRALRRRADPRQPDGGPASTATASSCASPRATRACEAALVEDLVGRQVAGLIVATSSHDRVVAPRGTGGLPVVLLNCRSDAPYPAIVPDEVAGRSRRGRPPRRGRAPRRDLARRRDAGTLAARRGPAARGSSPSSRGAGAVLDEQLSCQWWPEAAYDVMSQRAGRGRAPAARRVPQRPDRLRGLPGAGRGRARGAPTTCRWCPSTTPSWRSWLRPSPVERRAARVRDGSPRRGGAARHGGASRRAPACTMPVRARDSIAPTGGVTRTT